MKNISNQFSDRYEPKKTLLIYECTSQKQQSIYVESYDIGTNGKPINAHPLSANEILALSTLMQSSQELKTDYLKSAGIMPNNILHINPKGSGEVIWFTPAQEVNIYFAAALAIPSGKAKVPAMVWKAGKEGLAVYALKSNRKPLTNTQLYHAPYFNIYTDGAVCMGTVDVNIQQEGCLEEFVKAWQDYFWNSYFSHLMNDFNPVTCNIVQLWKRQVQGNDDFPTEILKKSNYTLKNILS